MQKDFQSAVNKSSSTQVSATGNSVSEAEQALKSWGIEYTKQPDGSILVPGDLDVSGRGLTRLPNLSSVKVVGNFYCHKNKLSSLENAPQSVGGNYYCFDNHLTSLKGAPHAVSDDFLCNKNKLRSLEHAPQSVGGDFYCFDNQLTLLEHMPKTFKTLTSDFGNFTSWDNVPEELRISPATKARLEQEREIAFSEGATVLKNAIKVSSPLRLKLKLS